MQTGCVNRIDFLTKSIYSQSLTNIQTNPYRLHRRVTRRLGWTKQNKRLETALVNSSPAKLFDWCVRFSAVTLPGAIQASLKAWDNALLCHGLDRH